MSTEEDFEAWAKSRGHDLRKTINGTYLYSAALNAFAGYQAATSRQEAKIKALVEALEAGPSLMHTYQDKSACLCSHCEFIRLKNAAIAAAKETP